MLEVKNLHTWFYTETTAAKAVDDISFSINEGETLCIVGESGCGKSATAMSIMQLLAKSSAYHPQGEIIYKGQDILKLSEIEKRKYRGNEISMIFQEPMSSLNPVLTIEFQLMETLINQKIDKTQKRQIVLDMLKQVKIPDPQRILKRYPHELSGGMKQRIMIAMAMIPQPSLLVADEPTTALDVTIQAQVLDLMKELQQKNGTAILLITHDLSVVQQVANRVAVMYAGKFVETGTNEEIFRNPQHPYTQKLLQSLPSTSQQGKKLQVIEGTVPLATAFPTGCRFAQRCEFKKEICSKEQPQLQVANDGIHHVACHFNLELADTQIVKPIEHKINTIDKNQKVLQIQDIKTWFPIRHGLLQTIKGHVKAVDGINLNLYRGETLALVGESGCGKSTLGKTIINLINANGGKVLFNGVNIGSLNGRQVKEIRKKVQIIFQDPYSSLNPRMTVGSTIIEAMKVHHIGKNKQDRLEKTQTLFEKVGLSKSMLNRYPHEFSGGQRQRISIARALSVEPQFIVCDEATSALDVSVQAQILNLLKDLQAEFNLTYLFITHDLSVVKYIANRVAVMYLGRIVEVANTEDLFKTPNHPYTRALFSAIPGISNSSNINRNEESISGEIPSPANPPNGCYFHPRCNKKIAQCEISYPQIKKNESNQIACHLY